MTMFFFCKKPIIQMRSPLFNNPLDKSTISIRLHNSAWLPKYDRPWRPGTFAHICAIYLTNGATSGWHSAGIIQLVRGTQTDLMANRRKCPLSTFAGSCRICNEPAPCLPAELDGIIIPYLPFKHLLVIPSIPYNNGLFRPLPQG